MVMTKWCGYCGSSIDLQDRNALHLLLNEKNYELTNRRSLSFQPTHMAPSYGNGTLSIRIIHQLPESHHRVLRTKSHSNLAT